MNILAVIAGALILLLVLSAYFALCGLAWFATVSTVGQSIERRYLVLGQWLFCFLVAGLAYLAS